VNYKVIITVGAVILESRYDAIVLDKKGQPRAALKPNYKFPA